MSARHLSGFGLRRALIAGIRRVVDQRAEIDRINVFPIADHDTGSNLAATLGTVLQGLRGPGPAGVGEVLRRAAVDASDGARGNSGAILALFAHGLGEALAGAPQLTTASLAEAVDRGSLLARTALAEPREGTMLTTIAAFAGELRAQAASGDLRAGFARALERAREALLHTRTQQPELRAAGVVDAGAQGFVCLLEGIGEYIERGRAASVFEIPAALVAAGVDATGSGDGPGAHRYCAECVLTAAIVDRAGLKSALCTLPLDRLVISGTREQVRLHAHVDNPGQWYGTVARFGAVSGEKVEDLHGPNRLAGRFRPSVAIATDTGADLPAGELERLEIHLVPQRLSVDGRDHIDRVSISPAEFYQAMRTSPVPPRTSQPPPGDFRRLFEHLLAHHESVVEVSLARPLSGTLQTAERAAARLAPGRVHVFDSCSVSAGQGLLALWAAEAAQAGLAAPAILAGLARMRLQTVVHAVIPDMQYAVRGGRAPRVALTLSRLLRFSLRLKVRPDGRLGMTGAIWGGKHLPERFARSVARRLDPARRYRVLIGHCDCAAEAGRLHTAFVSSGLHIDRAWVVECGVAIGAHAGPGTLVLGIQDYEPPSP